MSAPPSPTPPWLVSLHGGHSTGYCDHAQDTLEAIVEAACDAGMPVFGLTEHAPRVQAEYLFKEERAMGWDVARLEALFAAYAVHSRELQTRYAGKIDLLRGFEIEIVPPDRYVEVMLGYKEQYGFEYLVGSVHYVADIIIDHTLDLYGEAIRRCGGHEAFCIQYYRNIGAMVRAIRPEVVGHFDLVRRHARDEDSIATPAIRKAAFETLDTVAEFGAILDINTGGLRKGFGRPYPAPWILEAARERQIPVCFGDDSHGVKDVGFGIGTARDYLLENGYTEITALAHGPQGLMKKSISLSA
ncbi:MAG: histidinol-phosphatase [Candidatus Hydrogenedentes bacterium]|nr:histidinol-phosphatase [Candidatus Hydrogenedentota bacterium]